MMRYKNARWITPLSMLLTMLTLMLSGCDIGSKPSDMAKDQTLKMILSPSYGRAYLDPAQEVSNFTSIQPANLLFDGLVTLDRDEHVEPWGAVSWTISPDGLTYTFMLRPNQHFSDGTPVKASDYAWSIDRLANPCLASDNLGHGNFEFTFLAAIKDAVTFHSEGCADNEQPAGALRSLIGNSIVPNDSAHTLTIQLAQPTGYFLHALTMPLANVVERSVVSPGLGGDGAWTEHLVEGKTGRGGSGMFYLAKALSAPDNALSELVLKPNPYWWGIAAGKMPHFSEIDLRSIENSASLDTFKNDPSIAYGGTISPQALEQGAPELKKQPYYHEQATLFTTSLVFNETIAPFDDINIRKALCLAINREQLELNHQLYQGNPKGGYHSVGPVGPNSPPLYQGDLIPSWHLVLQGMDGYNAQLHGLDGAPVTGNATLAKRYWQQYLAAHGNQAPQITMIARGYGNIERALSHNWLQTLGITVLLVTPAFPAAEVASSSDQLAIENATINVADLAEAFLSDFTSISSNGFIPLQTDVPAADALLRQADTRSDMRQRAPLYQQAEQLLIDNVAVCPLYQLVNHYALRSWVKGGFVEDARGIFPNDAWVSGYIAKH